MKNAISVVLLLAVLPTFGQGVPASDADLKAAFCLASVLDTTRLAAEVRGVSAATERFYQQQMLMKNKLVAYTKARVLSLSSEAVTEFWVAKRAGENALAQQEQIISMCGSKAPAMSGNFRERLDSIDKCTEKENLSRLGLEKCKDLSFLPY